MNLYNAPKHPSTKAFMRDLLAVMAKHGLALVPSNDFKPSFHDPMLVVPFDEAAQAYIEERSYHEAP